MNKHTKAVLSLLASALLVFQGCSTGSSSTSAPTEAPARVVSPIASSDAGYSSNSIESDLFTMTKRVPSGLSKGETFDYEYVITAKEDLTNTIVTDTLPQGITYVSSSMQPQISGSNFAWNIGDMDAGQTKTFGVKAKADSVGTFTNCASVTAAPRACVTVVVGEPKLSIVKTVADSTLFLGESADFTIVVSNTGNTTAKDVVVTDTLPAGLTAQSPLVFQAGDLAPNESKSFNVVAGTTSKGEFVNSACAVGSNVGQVCDDATVIVNAPGIDVTKKGDASQFVGKTASYEIVVTNTGDIALNDVIVTDTVGQGMTLKSASGASISGNVAVWNISTLPAGKSMSYKVTTTAALAGNFCNSVSVQDPDLNLTASDSACTTWKGFPAVLLEVIDTNDPLLEGAKSSYIIRVTNQGNAPDYDVSISAAIAKELKVLSANGESRATISGNNVSFASIPVINPKQVIEYEIAVEAVTIGGGRSNFDLNTKLLNTPISETESTQVY